MNCWEILGIERTADTSIIKRAYKQQLLIHHPEDDPTGYQKVRTAYTRAMSEAKKQAKVSEVSNDEKVNIGAADEEIKDVKRSLLVNSFNLNDDNPDQDESYEEEENFTVIRRRYFSTEMYDRTQEKHDFMSRLINLYNNHQQRDDSEAWIDLLSHEVLWDLQVKLTINEEMLKFFSENHDLNDNIWVIIENNTGLLTDIYMKSEQYPAYFVDKYVLATQKIDTPKKWKSHNKSNITIIQWRRISWGIYCFGFMNIITWILMFVLFNIFSILIIFIIMLIRSVLFVRKRISKIVMWEYTFSYFNSWGKRYEFKYIDVIKVIKTNSMTYIYLKNKKIKFNNYETEKLNSLIVKMSKYGKWDGNTMVVQDNM